MGWRLRLRAAESLGLKFYSWGLWRCSAWALQLFGISQLNPRGPALKLQSSVSPSRVLFRWCNLCIWVLAGALSAQPFKERPQGPPKGTSWWTPKFVP